MSFLDLKELHFFLIKINANFVILYININPFTKIIVKSNHILIKCAKD